MNLGKYLRPHRESGADHCPDLQDQTRSGREVGPGKRGSGFLMALGFAGLLLCTNCMKPKKSAATPELPHVEPIQTTHGGEPLRLDGSQIKPMFTEMLAIDLTAVVRVASAQNVDIRSARQAVEARKGEYESTVGGAFPAIVPTALFEHVEGTVRATEGNLVGVGFNTFQPSIALQWVVNPGRVIYEIIAAKKRLAATEHQEKAVALETLRKAAIQYYELVLAQSHVSAAHQGVMEAEELFRISRLRQQTGTGVPADTMRAEARLAERRQDMVAALRDLYHASVGLAVTLHLDASVTLIPRISELPPTPLVRDDLAIEELLKIAVAFRPDLASVRTLVESAAAQRHQRWWGGFGPGLALAYQIGGITGHANNVGAARGIPSNLIVNPASSNGSFSANPVGNALVREGLLRGSRRAGGRGDQTTGFSSQQRATAKIGWHLSLATFGDLKTAKAEERQAILEAERALDEVRAQVIVAVQSSRANDQLIDLAQRQVSAAEEALRPTQVNLQAGTMTTLDVLQAQDAATQARLRYAEAVVHYNQSQINLRASLGLLDEAAFSLADTTEDSNPTGEEG